MLLAYHDRSDGGLFVTLLEMAFAGGSGVELDIAPSDAGAGDGDPLAALFNEELGAVMQVRAADVAAVHASTSRARAGRVRARASGAAVPRATAIGGPRRATVLLDEPRAALRGVWSETTPPHAARCATNPTCADEEHAAPPRRRRPGLSARSDLRSRRGRRRAVRRRAARGRGWRSCASRA